MKRILNSLKNFSDYTRLNLHRFYRGSTSLLFVVRVEGESGWPYLAPGKRYLASSLFVPRVGDWVTFQNPREQERVFVKRVKAVCGREYFMEGAVSWASSSRDFGLVERRFVLGKVLKYGAEH